MKSLAVSAIRRPYPSTKAPPLPTRREAASAPVKAKVRERCDVSVQSIRYKIASDVTVVSAVLLD